MACIIMLCGFAEVDLMNFEKHTHSQIQLVNHKLLGWLRN